MTQRSSFFWYLILIAAFCAFGFYAFQSTYLLQQKENTQKEQQAREHLETLVQVWESGVFSRAKSWFDEIEKTQDLRVLELRWRQSNAWFDAVYMWNAQQFLYPAEESDVAKAIPPECNPKENPFFTRDCSPPFSSLEESNHIANVVGSALIEDNKPRQAVKILTQWSPSTDTLLEKITQPVDTSTFVSRAILALSIDTKSVPLDTFSTNLLSLDIIALQSLSDVQKLPIQDVNFRLVLERIQRRISAYTEINEHLRRTVLAKELKVHADPYGSSPYLFLTRRQSSGLSNAIQIDPFLLLKEMFQQETKTSIRPVVLDAQGNLLLGQFAPLKANEEIWVQIPCGRLFPHLRAAYIRPKEIPDALNTGTLSLFLPLILSAIIAGLAIFGSVQAERKQREFIERQQAFVARVTHELKTPLAGIRLMAESLQLGIVQTPEQSLQFTERIISETDRLESRIDEVLEGTRQAQLKKKEMLNGKILIEDLHKEWSVRFNEAGGILRVEHEGTPIVVADKMLLIDALKNLLSNAIKYRREDRPLRCILKVSAKKSWVEFSVSDNGLGVPLAYRKSIFQRFVRVEGPHRGLSGGHGLGLAFVEETAQAHKGSIRCIDGILGGAQFVLRLPKR